MKNSDMRTFVKCFVIIIVIMTLGAILLFYEIDNIIAFVLLAIPFLGAAYTSETGIGFGILFVLFSILESIIISLLITGINRFLKKPGSK